MRTRRPAAEQLPADELFRSRLENQIDLRHPLVQLSHRLPWSALEQALSPRLPVTTGTGGRPALPMRLIAGLLYLKHAYDLSDEAVCERWLENPYWQFFTGEVVFQTCLPCDPSSLTRWRQRLGEAGMEELLAHTINTAHAVKAVDARELSRVIVDTTVQEKAIAHPTDNRLLEVARKKLVLLAKRHGIALRQTYARQGPALSRKAGRYAHARQFKRMRKVLRRQRTILGRVLRDLQRKLAQRESSVRERIGVWLERAHRLLTQRPKDNQKLYALHAPEVECISKGKARNPYEFGVKVGIAVSARKGLDRGRAQFSRQSLRRRHVGRAIGTGARAAPGCECDPADGHRGLGVSRARGGGCADPASGQSQNADATAMALDQTKASGRAGDRTSETGLPLESLPSQRRPRRCTARARLRRRLQPAVAAALDRIFACLVAGGAGAFLNVLKPPVARKHGIWCLRVVFQGRLIRKPLGVHGSRHHCSSCVNRPSDCL